MFVMNYDEGQGWHDARIVPYGPIELDPSAMCLHYGQTVFEGMKAYRAKDGRVLLFRPEKNMARLNVSNERLCIPKIDEAFALKCIEKLVSIEKDWIPTAEGTSLYISLYFCYRRTCWCTSGQTSYVYGDLFSGWRLLSGRFESG